MRQESRTVAGPADLDLAVDVGRVVVHLDGAPGGDEAAETANGETEIEGNAPGELEVRVEVRHDPTAAGGWAQRLGEVASWLGSVAAAPDTDDGRRSRLGGRGRGARGGHRVVRAGCRRRGPDADGALDHGAAAADGAAGGHGVGTAGLARDGPDRRR